MNRKRHFALLPALLALAVLTSGCGIISKLRAKADMNEGVREFNRNNFESAEARFKHALELSPGMPNAQLFYAQSIKARFDQELSPELATKTVQAYEDIIKSNPSNSDVLDQALAYQANVYDRLSNVVEHDKAGEFIQKRRDVLLRRAELPSTSAQRKAEALYTIGHTYWKDSYYNYTERYSKQSRPIPPEEAEKMRPIILKGHQYFQQALQIDPQLANAWYYEKMMFNEEIRIENNPEKRKELQKKADEANEMYSKVQEQIRKSQAG